jgi:hypothetical protein
MLLHQCGGWRCAREQMADDARIASDISIGIILSSFVGME